VTSITVLEAEYTN